MLFSAQLDSGTNISGFLRLHVFLYTYHGVSLNFLLMHARTRTHKHTHTEFHVCSHTFAQAHTHPHVSRWPSLMSTHRHTRPRVNSLHVLTRTQTPMQRTVMCSHARAHILTHPPLPNVYCSATGIWVPGGLAQSQSYSAQAHISVSSPALYSHLVYPTCTIAPCRDVQNRTLDFLPKSVVSRSFPSQEQGIHSSP